MQPRETEILVTGSRTMSAFRKNFQLYWWTITSCTFKMQECTNQGISGLNVTEASCLVRNVHEQSSPSKTGLDVMQSHPLHRTRFSQYQASSAALGWQGDGDRHIMHRIQSGGWPYSKLGRDSSKRMFQHSVDWVVFSFQSFTLFYFLNLSFPPFSFSWLLPLPLPLPCFSGSTR